MAVVAGTATAVSNSVSRRQANRWAQEDQAAYRLPPSQPQYAPPRRLRRAARRAGRRLRAAPQARRAQGRRHPHRRGVRGEEGAAPRPLSASSLWTHEITGGRSVPRDGTNDVLPLGRPSHAGSAPHRRPLPQRLRPDGTATHSSGSQAHPTDTGDYEAAWAPEAPEGDVWTARPWVHPERRQEEGRTARKRVPRTSHAAFERVARPEPIAILARRRPTAWPIVPLRQRAWPSHRSRITAARRR